MARRVVDVPADEVQPGDWADHKSGDLDPREVASVDQDGGTIALYLLTDTPVTGLPIGNSDFTRSIESA